MAENRSLVARREPLVHLGAAVIGGTVGSLLLGTVAVAGRTGALTLALSLVVAALVRAVGLGRAEWRREGPAIRDYVGLVARFLAAFVIVVVATI